MVSCDDVVAGAGKLLEKIDEIKISDLNLSTGRKLSLLPRDL